ncbi:hypothetical protein STCU_03165 [Strigomonas culicis]|uniref:Uncharacterized protein n=1 Tax=Strigomonas culicis TaxID=28005 RepID=S9USS2_9TRYP|nr:hypothetical protein STCU_03165 [Strigomonas culicis]|eukprot:EPY31859.1 hypothetical protein STCU_03165 [Strigomonas culicis]
MRPWRCDDRFQDWMKSFTYLDSPAVQYSLLSRFWQCARSEEGEEPLEDYHRLGRSEVMFYVERSRSGMMRTGMWETYPYNQNDLRRIAEEDGLKMRVWRHQRELEIQSKEGKIDDALQNSVLGSFSKR